MKYIFVVLAVIMPCFSGAQETAIRWIDDLSWEQIIQKAKSENKYIFLDCYATWCGPCKRMDNEVYINEAVGRFFNDQFLSVRVQMDKTPNDSKYIQDWYLDATKIANEFRVLSFPTYIFLSSNGEVVHKATGFMLPDDFISLGRTAISPGKKYENPFEEYDILKQEYEKGIKRYEKMPFMVKTARSLGDTGIARSVIKEYLTHLKGLNTEHVYTIENIEFLASVISSKSSFFYFFYKNGGRCDNVMKRPGYAQNVIDRIIIREEVEPFIKTKTTGPQMTGTIQNLRDPNWNVLYKTIKKRYDRRYAMRNVLEAKIAWYERVERNPIYTSYYVEKWQRFGYDTTEALMDATFNNVAFDIYAKVLEKKQINAAIKWMGGIVRRTNERDAFYLDTYACLLYKMGRQKEAIHFEEVAYSRAKLMQNETVAQVLLSTLEKMKSGELLRH